MKIVIDATSLLLPSAGVKNYIHFWLSSIVKESRARGDRVGTYPPGTWPSTFLNHQKSVTHSLVTNLLLDLVGINNISGNPALSLFLRGADVFHCSQHTANLPKHRTVTATVFDLSCWTVPEYHTSENVAATRQYGETILTAADGLIAISAHARADASEILGISGDRIRVIYPGVADSFYTAGDADASKIRDKYQLSRRYILFVGCIEPRKNLPALIHSYCRLPDALRREVELIVAGPFGWASEETRIMLTAGTPGIRYLGYVPEDDLPGLYRGADILAYPSFYEGFGLPAAQAMAAGIPVLTSNRSCLPEVVGDAGILVDPNNYDEIEAALEQILTSSRLAEELARRGRIRASAYRWGLCAAQSLDFFHEVSGL
jgi:alpha-1,3-rhamnosyl/mannosyltransferase